MSPPFYIIKQKQTRLHLFIASHTKKGENSQSKKEIITRKESIKTDKEEKNQANDLMLAELAKAIQPVF